VGAIQAVIGVDIGTTSTKSVVFDTKGAMLGRYSVDYPLLQPRPGWAEQEPDAITYAAVRSMRGAIDASGLDGASVIAVGVSSAMHSIIAVDEVGMPLTRSITWADGRSEGEARRIKRESEGIYHRTGTAIHPMSPLPKLVWLRDNFPEVWARAAKFVSIKEYVLYSLFGEWVVDRSLASATGLLNIHSLEWDEQALAIAGIGTDRLSALQAGTYRLQGMKQTYADRMGLDAQTPFFLGGSDGALANIGVGAIGPGEMAVTIGTSAAVRMMTNQPLTDKEQRTFCYHVADRSYIIGGATNNGGIVLQWLRESMFAEGNRGIGGRGEAGYREVDDREAGQEAGNREAGNPEAGNPEAGNREAGKQGDEFLSVAAVEARESFDALLEEAAQVSPGANGLLFLPFLTGERAPIWNSEARGTFFGAGLEHRREHFVRAGLEGVMLGVLSVAEALKDLAGPAREVRASGGFARSPLWRQMLADMLGQEIRVPRVTEASALGAAVMALQGAGELAHWSEAKAWIPIEETLEPNLRVTETYRELLAMYTRLCGVLPESFAAMAEFQRKQHKG
jgi:gluconokinase